MDDSSCHVYQNGWTLGHTKRQVETQTYEQELSDTDILMDRKILFTHCILMNFT